jgi:glutaconate CoA-transferase subunit B
LDFRTSAGHLNGGKNPRAKLGMPGAGPKLVVTDKAIFGFDEESGEMMLTSLHPGIEIDEVQAQVGWPLKVNTDLKITQPPTKEEIRIIEKDLDPDGVYTKN